MASLNLPALRSRVLLGYLAFGALGCLLLASGENAVLLVLSLTLFTFTGLVVLRHAGGFMLTPTTLFFLFFTIFTYVWGLGYFLLDGQGVSYGGGVRNYTFYAALNGGLLVFAAGIVLASLSARFFPRAELARFRRTPWRDTHNQPGDHLVIFLFGAVALLVTAIYIRNRGIIPIIEILGASGSDDVYELYSATRATFSRYGREAGSYFYQGYFQQFYLVVLPFVTLYVGARFLRNRTLSLGALWLVLGLLTGFFLAMSLQRWPLMFFVLMNYVLFANYRGRIGVSHAVLFLVLALLVFTLLTSLRGMGDLAEVLYWAQNRILKTNVDVLYSMFEMFPRHFAFFGGQAILSDIRGVLPGPDVAFSRWLYDALYRVYGNGTTPTLFWGQLYADFGVPGVLVGSMAAGFLMQWFYIAYLRATKTLLRLVVYVVITMALAGLAITSPISILFQLGVVSTLLLVAVLKVMRWPLQAESPALAVS
ncbi:MAG: hypothetical protein V3U35_07800 [Candidatus Neomarinimicrobiota bacterium]